ncbi:plasma-membrane proton-efflux P-type ATPase [Ferrimicrobium sp.]|uniref:plasma-membrane proton-efflux P-type ATPase n=1 Tax=Ferrimicrobium sp. TaxID=2926050 RepID=UPI002616B842|nr:plasma-membrane proton-efflux P-type ATPase [Ferrimicrobium sp.]
MPEPFVPDSETHGLTTAEVAQRRKQYGPNAIVHPKEHPFALFLKKFWAPVPWMLEVTLILELALGKSAEAIVIALLLVLNSVLSFSQESRAKKALELLQSKLQITARVFRDGSWQQVPALDLVPGDLIHLRIGDLAPADLRIVDGELLVDQSALTGESLPVEHHCGDTVYSASIIRRGEASGEVTATGAKSYFGKTADLVRTAGSASHLEVLVLGIVKWLVTFDIVLVVLVLVDALVRGITLSHIAPFALILLVASVPIALPATFTLATAVAAMELVRRGILVTRLAAIEEAASMTVLLSDKTGTLTKNELRVQSIVTFGDATDADVLFAAAMASDASTQDPLDLATLAKAQQLGIKPVPRATFSPFDPATKRSESTYLDASGSEHHALKGAPQVLKTLITGGEEPSTLTGTLVDLARSGSRVLGIAGGVASDLKLLGLIAFADPLRDDAVEILQQLAGLGITVKMVTGDTPETAASIATQLGLSGKVCSPDNSESTCAVYAGVFPEDKYKLVAAHQTQRAIVGMTGDGVNDAPALRQAEVGIAVATATDVAKASASLVLTTPGLAGLVDAIDMGRAVYQRLLTYTLNKIVKTLQVALFLSIGVLVLGKLVVTPLLILLLLFANDLVTMSLASDNVHPSKDPNHWSVAALMRTSGIIALAWLLFSFATYAFASLAGLSQRQLQTLDFVALVFSGLANVLLLRERGHLWASKPGTFLLLASGVDTLVVGLFATTGVLMSAVPVEAVILVFIGTLIWVIVLDFVKVKLVTHGTALLA